MQQQHAPLPSPVAAFFGAAGFNLCISVFDSRRGQRDGEEYEKVLSFFPSTAPLSARMSIVGLAQALTSFVANVSEESCPFRVMDAEVNKWVMFECEPSIWILTVVKKSWATSSCTDAALQGLLQGVHTVFTLLHGRLSQLLDQDPSAFGVRRVLQPLLDEVGQRLQQPETKDLRVLANPLAPHHPTAVPLLATSHQAFLAVQCLVNQLLITSFYGNRLVMGAMVLWSGMPLWSTLGTGDTAALTVLALRALAPAAKAAQQLLQGRRPASIHEPLTETLLSPQQWRLGAQAAPFGGASSSGSSVGGSGGNGTTSPAAAAPPPAPPPPFLSSFLCPKLRMLPRAATPLLPAPQPPQGLGGGGQQEVLPMAHVWLQDVGEWALLLPYQRGPLLVLVLLHDAVPPPTEVLAALAAVLNRGAGPATTLLAGEVPHRNLWHHKGHRYCYVDGLCRASRYTPLRKVHTLSPSTLRQLARLRNKLDEWQQQDSRGQPQEGQEHELGEDEQEVIVRTGLDSWVMVRTAPGGRHLYSALEAVPEHNLVAVAQRLDGLCDTLFPGVFLQL